MMRNAKARSSAPLGCTFESCSIPPATIGVSLAKQARALQAVGTQARDLLGCCPMIPGLPVSSRLGDFDVSILLALGSNEPSRAIVVSRGIERGT